MDVVDTMFICGRSNPMPMAWTSQIAVVSMQVIDEHGTDITDRELSAMPYTTALVKETLRHKAIVSSVWRKTLVDIELGGYRIPKVRVTHQHQTAHCMTLI